MKKILIVKLSAVGDIVHTIPSLMALRAAFPDAHIGWVVEELSANLLENHPAIDSLYVIPKKRWRKNFFKYFNSEISPFIKKIRNEKYDIAIDFQGLTKSGVIALLSGAKMRIGFGDKDGRELNKLFTNEKIIPPPENVHIVERNLSLLTPLGILNPKPVFHIPIQPSDKEYINDWLKKENVKEGFIILNPGAGWITKKLPLEKLIELGKRIYEELKKEIILSWGPGDENIVKKIKDTLNKDKNYVHIAPSTTFRQFCAMLEHCEGFIGGDTGPMHLAAAFEVPVVSFFGASDAARNSPYCKRKFVVQLNDIQCVPCWKTTCKYNTIKCLNEINGDTLFDGLKKIII